MRTLAESTRQPPRRVGAGRCGRQTLFAVGRAIGWTAAFIAVACLLGYFVAAPLQRLLAPLPDRLRVRRVQTAIGLSVYRAESLPRGVPLRGYRTMDDMPLDVVFPLSLPTQPPYERLLLVPTSMLFDVAHDMDSWWGLRSGDWSYVRSGTETAPDGTVWTIYVPAVR